MPYVSVTRLRLRSVWFLPRFAWHAVTSFNQARRADGNLAVTARKADGANWTLSVWRNREAMRTFMMAGAHRSAMPLLQNWCDEAAVAHWEQASPALPDWAEAERRLGADGRVSAVKSPSPAHSRGNPLGSSAQAPTTVESTP